MAIYLPDQNALFLRIPFTASGFVSRVLRETLELTTQSVGHMYSHKDLVGTLRFERDPYTFTFVRNPLDWYSSFWTAKQDAGEEWGYAEPHALWHPNWPIDPEYADNEFASFITKVCDRGGHLQETYRLYTGRGTSDEIHFIGKTETLVDDLTTVLDTIGVDVAPMALVRRKPRAARRNRVDYTPELVGMVAHAERHTFDEYGYSPPLRTPAQRAADPYTVNDIPGWFRREDQDLFSTLLAWQVANEPPGDLVELGCYLGKSAVVIGESQQEDETFTVCDLFGDDAPDSANSAENQDSYLNLNRQQFEHYYRSIRGTLPVVLQMPTSGILEHVKPGSARFVHVDASHLYEHVALDVIAARTMLRPGGIVVFDDYRSEHTQGVAAAVWEAMLSLGLNPIVVTAMKFYGTWDDPAPAQQVVHDWVVSQSRYHLKDQVIKGHKVLRVSGRSAIPGAGNGAAEAAGAEPAGA